MTGPREMRSFLLVLMAGVSRCDSPTVPTPSSSSSSSSSSRSFTAPSKAPIDVPPTPEGCAHTGALEGIERDPACIMKGDDETLTRDAMKQLTMELKPDRPTVTAGGTVVARLSIFNSSNDEVRLVLDAAPSNAGTRPDWSRLKGVPEPKFTDAGTSAGGNYRLMMPVRTLDTHDRSVDGLPSTPGISTVTLRPLLVRLRPGGRLTHTFTWWALRIPTPDPITRDDAGHRFVPKTAPVPLTPGDYVVAIELPLHGISKSESTLTMPVRVDKPDMTQGR